MRKTAFILVSVLAVSLFAVAAQAFHASSSKPPKQAGKQLGLADLQTTGKARFGNHNLKGLYEFQADGVVEVNGVPTRGFWEVGKFEADGKGKISNGVEYSTLLSSSDEAVIDRNFTFSGTYTVNPDGTATGQVTVDVAPGVEITKKLWLIIHSVGKEGIANGFDGGHADADLGGGVRGNTRSHVGHRIEIAK